MQIHEVMRRYLMGYQALGMASGTISVFSSVFKIFRLWAEQQGVTTIEQLTPELFSGYQLELRFRLNRYGRPIGLKRQYQHVGMLKQWGRYLVEQDFLVSDPTRKLALPRLPKLLPRIIPDQDQAARLMAAPVGPSLLAYRDRAILEVMYGAGLRLSEVSHLNVGDLDLVGGYGWVRHGKGGKDRVVPLGKLACQALEVYLDAVRPALYNGKESEGLFLSHRGERLSGYGVYCVVQRAVKRARLSRKITPHALRHAAATHMLQNGASIRHLQEFLGHASLETTQVYTQITITELKAIHAKYHPREHEEGSGLKDEVRVKNA